MANVILLNSETNAVDKDAKFQIAHLVFVAIRVSCQQASERAREVTKVDMEDRHIA